MSSQDSTLKRRPKTAQMLPPSLPNLFLAALLGTAMTRQRLAELVYSVNGMVIVSFFLILGAAISAAMAKNLLRRFRAKRGQTERSSE